MKIKFSKALALVLSLMMLIGTLSVPVMATAENSEPATMYDGYVMADFSNLDYSDLEKYTNTMSGKVYALGSSVFNPSPVAYGDGKSSLRVTLDTSFAYLNFALDAPAWEEYSKANPNALIKVRFKGDESGDRINFIHSKLPNGKYVGYTGSANAVTTSTDWQISARKLSDVAAITGDSSAPDANTLYFKVDFNGWGLGNGNWKDGRGFYIDKIWIENPTTWAPEKNGSDDMVRELNVPLSQNGSISYAYPREGGSDSYKYFYITAFQSQQSNFSTNTPDKKLFCGKDYRYVNLWMYSPYPQAGGTTIAINWHEVTGYNADGSKIFKETTRISRNYASSVRFDWSGWKLVSIPLPANTAGSYQINVGTEDAPEMVTEYYYINNIKNSTSWSNFAGRARVQNDKTPVVDVKGKPIDSSNPVFHQTGYFGVDGLWVSKKAPAQPAATENTQETPALAALNGDIVVSEHNSTTKPANIPNFSVVGGVSNLYNTTAKSVDFGNKRVNSEATGFSGGSMPEYGVIGSTGFTTLTTQKYLNFWMYSPGIRYDEYGNYSEYIATFQYQNGTGTSNAHLGIPAKWQGWKLFSIPLSEFQNTKAPSESAPLKLNILKISANGWLPIINATTDGTHYYTDAELKKDTRKTNNYNVWPTNKNYFFVDRMWFSNEAAATSFGEIGKPDWTETDANGDSVLNWTAQSKIGKIGKSGTEKAKIIDYDRIRGTHTLFEADVTAKDNILTAKAELQNDHTYTVLLPEIFDTYGNAIASKDRTTVIESGTNSKFTYTLDDNNNATITGYTDNLSDAELKNLVIPEKLFDTYPVVGVGGFGNNKTIETLSLPSSVKKLLNNAFNGCSNLTTVTMPSCEEIGGGAFYGCAKLVYMNSDYYGEIVLPENLKTLGDQAFRTANSTKTVILPATLTKANGAFYRNSGVKNMYFPENMAESTYAKTLVGGDVSFNTINAYGTASSYIATYAESEDAVDNWTGDSYEKSGKKFFNFIEENSDVFVYDISYENANGNTLRGTNKDAGTTGAGVNARLFNTGDEAQSLKAIIAVTSAAGKLKDVDIADIAVPAYAGFTLTAEELMAENAVLADGDVIKVMLWEDMASIKPVVTMDIVYVIDGSKEEILVMAIGNSFAQDSMTYLKRIAAADGVNISSYNCYVGGRPLNAHYNAWVNEVADYEIQPEGARSTMMTSSNDMVKMYDWDYILVQGTTHSSHYDTGLWGDDAATVWTTLADGIAQAAPNAKRFVHATWAPYETLSATMNSGMFAGGTPDARGAYTKALLERQQLGADIFSTESREDGSGAYIPTAVAVDYLIRHYGFPEYEGELTDGKYYSNAATSRGVYRDTTCHLTDNVGRVLAGLVWYEMITGTPATENAYTRSTLSAEDMTMIKEAAHYACQNYATYDPATIVPAE